MTNNCTQNQLCVNTDGGFICECKPGFRSLDGGATCQGTAILLSQYAMIILNFVSIRKLKNLTVSLQILTNVQREFHAVLKYALTQWEAILAAAILDTLLMQTVPLVP